MEWISVKDKVPELQFNGMGIQDWPSEDVLVLCKDSQMYVAYYTIYGQWTVQETGCGCCADYVHPTHWMPLPEIPK